MNRDTEVRAAVLDERAARRGESATATTDGNTNIDISFWWDALGCTCGQCDNCQSSVARLFVDKSKILIGDVDCSPRLLEERMVRRTAPHIFRVRSQMASQLMSESLEALPRELQLREDIGRAQCCVEFAHAAWWTEDCATKMASTCNHHVTKGIAFTGTRTICFSLEWRTSGNPSSLRLERCQRIAAENKFTIRVRSYLDEMLGKTSRARSG